MSFRVLCLLLAATFVRAGLEFGAEPDFARVAAQALAESAPLLSAWSPDGKRFAFYQGGTIWEIDLVSGKKRPVIKLNVANDCSLSWAGSLLVGCANSISTIDVRSGRAKRLLASPAGLSNVHFSPDGRYITFIQKHGLAWITSEGGPIHGVSGDTSDNLLAGELDPLYAHEFHMREGYWWSHDSAAVAYLETDRTASGEYPQAGKTLPGLKLKIVLIGSGKTTEVTSGSADRPYLAGVVWLPDNKRIAFESLNRLQNQLIVNVFDTGSAATTPVFTLKDDYWINLPGAPVFLANGEQFLLATEQTGNRHIYLHDLKGQLEKDLTPGKTEVSGLPVLDEKKEVTYFSALAANSRDLHLFSCSLNGQDLQDITNEPGWHNTSLNSTKTAFVDSHSTADSPASVTLRRLDGSEISVVKAATKVEVSKAEFQEVKLHNGDLLPLMMWKPLDFSKDKKYPVIVYTLSGPPGHVVKNDWDGWQSAWNRAMAGKGYVVVGLDTRGSGGYGHYFEEYVHYRFGAQELADLREAFSYLTRQPYVDADRMGVWGCDYGAHNVIHAMLEFSNGFKAGVADAPITKWTIFDAYFVERYLGLPAKRITEYADSSALGNARRLRGKLLVLTSPADPFIRPDQFGGLKGALDRAQKPFETLEFPNSDYRSDPASLAKLMTRMADFFAANL